MPAYRIGLVGEASYQPAIRRSKPGDRIRLLHETDNPFDRNAIRAANGRGETIGYIARESWLKRVILDEGQSVAASIEEITGGIAGKPVLGVVLTVWWDTDEPAPVPPPVLPSRKASGTGSEMPQNYPAARPGDSVEAASKGCGILAVVIAGVIIIAVIAS